MKNISIIGGGANGVSAFIEFFIQLSTAGLEKEVSIRIIEKDERLGYGLAFGTPQPGHILNTQAELMGIYAHEPAHFSKWLKKHPDAREIKGDEKTDKAYTTRRYYGEYIACQAKKYLKLAKDKQLHVDLVHQNIVDLQHDPSGYTLLAEDGSSYHSDYVILALGTPKPNNYKEYLAYDHYLDFPWPATRIKEKIKSTDKVGILGSSLSAIDSIMTLLDEGHVGEIHLFSPDGLLPRVQPIHNKGHERKLLTLENLHRQKRKNLENPRVKSLIRLFRKEVERFTGKPLDWKETGQRTESCLALLRWDIDCAQMGGDGLLNVADSLRYDASTIWSWMDTDQKILFKKWVGRYWAINRHPMPLHNAKKLLHLLTTGQLKVHAMKSSDSIQAMDKVFTLETSEEEIIPVDKLINATGSSSDLDQMDGQLIDNLLRKQYIQPYLVGGAVISERTMQLIAPEGGDNIYAVGHLANGILMDVNAVWYNVQTISILVKDVLFRLKNKGN
ncbi:hypothetical protein GCM10007049_10890 [Echinicola pacifica]|uniref:FAD-dependent urate hydroxylase HpyO/Asp monooxygenase CreE-like FAD/NAD(P)-binding domain-containing protein n=1 Tax=Echinicola pacifica TaxID=346377 RepID=A0A918PR15_9BACT|nr:FAD/NAD(P)-binding protein [Echinicola pacifica]GGZ20165.1 hypothetical protein GCM10007049_10890 [Echinicola pacifica]